MFEEEAYIGKRDKHEKKMTYREKMAKNLRKQNKQKQQNESPFPTQCWPAQLQHPLYQHKD